MNKLLSGLGQTGRAVVFSTFALFLAAGVAQAATTISTSITTGGAITTTSTLSVTGLATLLGGATTTQLTLLSGDTVKNAAASSTVISGNLSLGNATVPVSVSTSTLAVGCIQMFATSTATLVHLDFNKQGTTTISGGSSAGVVTWVYGACPI